jgi:integrase
MAKGIKREDREAWEQRGGRIRTDSKGRAVYIIRKQIDSRRYEVSTKRHTLDAALTEWTRFEKDPDGYQAGGTPAAEAIFLDNDLSEDFLAWSKNERKNSKGWLRQQKHYLAWWMEALKGVDLRRATLRDHIMPKLEGDKVTAKGHRIAVLKILYAWLRTERRVLATVDDPTYGALKVPQVQPAQHKKSKVIPAEHLALVLEGLASDRWRDLLRVLAGTGMHVSELERFSKDGTLEPLPRDGKSEGAAGVIVIPTTKSGETLRVAVSKPVLEAATRVLEAGSFDRRKLGKAIKSACLAVKRPDGKFGIPVFGPGRLRHTVATAAVNAGADIAAVSSFLGHKSPRTTRRFYSTLGTPRKIFTLA